MTYLKRAPLFLVLIGLASGQLFFSTTEARIYGEEPLRDYGYWEERWVDDGMGSRRRESVYIPGLNDRLRDKEQDEKHYTAIRERFLDLHGRLWQNQKENVVEILNITREDPNARCVDQFGNRMSLSCEWTDSSGRARQKTYRDLNTYLFKDQRPEQMKAYHELYDQPSNADSSNGAGNGPSLSDGGRDSQSGPSRSGSSSEEAYRRYMQQGHLQGRQGSGGVSRSYRSASPDFGPRRAPAARPSGGVQRVYRSTAIQQE